MIVEAECEQYPREFPDGLDRKPFDLARAVYGRAVG